jgi:hypothetical protein
LGAASANALMSPGQASLINSATNAAAAPVTSAELSQLPAASPSLMGLLKTGGMAGLGASLGSSLAPQSNSSTNGLPPNFNSPTLPGANPGMQLGGRPAGQMPSFANYSPYASVTGGYPGGGTYNFFPPTT